MADIVVSVASKVAEYLVAPVGRQCGYVIFTNKYVGQLKEELEKLDDAMVEVQRSVVFAQNNNKEIKLEVNRWWNNAETVANSARGVLNNDGRAKKTCFCGWLLNPKKSYCLGRDARKTVQAIQALILQKRQFKKVHYDNTLPPGYVPRPTNENTSASDWGDTITDSRASIFQGIMKALDDEKIKVIGVYGPGGVGKTTLLEVVKKKLRNEKRLFDMVAVAEVRQALDLKKIQDDIAYALGVDLKNEPSEAGRRDLLFNRLQMNPSEKVLVILDDLWKKLDLRAVGIPSGDESRGCKLLLTSRFEDVLQKMKCASPIFHLKGLEDNEALKLFEKEVGDRLEDEEELKEIAPQVVKKLAGLPLLIISIARTLKDSDPAAWRSSLITIDAEEKETIVQFSYDHLKSEDARSLFLLCGLIGGTIEVETLLVLGMGLGLFEECKETIQNSRDRLDTLLSELRSACLLLDGGDDKDDVTIHDLYSEVVVSTPFRDKISLMSNSNNGTWPKEKLEECWAGLFNVGNDRIAEIMPCRFPHAKILMLSEQYFMGDCSRMDFTHMKELRALCLCSMSIASLPSSMEILGNLQSLSINCYVEDIAILGKLKALRILSFARSRISRLPKEIGELTNLQSLNLSNCYSLKMIEAGAIKGLINLEELHMKKSFYKLMGEHEIPSESCGAGLAELKSLTKLTSLEISIPDLTILLEDGDLPFGNLIRFWIKIGNIGGREFKGLRTMGLDLEGNDNILSREWVQKALQKTQYLYLRKLSEFKKSAHKLCTQGLRELKHLDIDNSPSLKYIANSSDGLRLVAFTKLESLHLHNLINLEKIYHGPITPECFSKLKAVTISQCDRMKYLWRLSDMQRFVQLEEIEVWRCDSMQSIVAHDAKEDIVSADYKVELPNVRRLELAQLPNMTSFCTRAEITSEITPIQVSFPRLESLVMVGLLDLEKILCGQHPLEYSNLKSIEIREPRSKSSFFKSDWILKLPNLETLKIESSPSAEVVFDLGELKVMRDVEILSRLMELAIYESPNLRCMWKQDVKLRGISVFRNLKHLEVFNTGLAFLFPVSVAKCLREIRVIFVEDCPNMKAVIVDEEGRDEGIDDTIEFPLLERLYVRFCPIEKFFSYPHGKKELVTATSDSQDAYSDSFFDQKVSLPSLECLWLDSLGSLKRIWHEELPRSSFCELATLTLKNCSELLNVFPLTIIGRLHNLKEVKVSNSLRLESFELLFDCGSFGSNTERKIVSLPKLEKVEVTLPNIRELEIEGLRCKELWNNQIPTYSFWKLESLELNNCDNLQCIAPSHMWKRLQCCLKTLQVISCRSIEIIYEGDGTDTESGKLRRLVLRDLKNLRHIWQSNGLPNIPFPNLRCIEAVRCSRLEMLFTTFTAKFLGQIENLVVESCEDMELIAGHEKWEEATRTTITFSKLAALGLFELPKFRGFLPEKHSLKSPYSEDFPSLQYLSIVRCGAEPNRGIIDPERWGL